MDIKEDDLNELNKIKMFTMVIQLHKSKLLKKIRILSIPVKMNIYRKQKTK